MKNAEVALTLLVIILASTPAKSFHLVAFNIEA